MKSRTKIIGYLGEKAACQYLLSNGYMILFRNYRKKFGEIDIVARHSSGLVVIVEVKTLFSVKQLEGNPVICLARNNVPENRFLFSAKQFLEPEDNLSHAKLNKLRKIGEFFINSHPYLINEDKGWRIDLIAVILEEGESGNWKARIRHHEGIG